MKIKIRYENVMTTLDVPEDDFTVMIETDYQQRLADAEPGETITHRTPDEILGELNRKEYNNWHRYKEHLEFSPKLKNLNGQIGKRTGGNNEDDLEFSINLIEDPHPYTYDSDYEDMCNLIRAVLKPKQAALLISVVLDDVPVGTIAENEGVSSSAISHRLQIAKNNLKKILKNPHI